MTALKLIIPSLKPLDTTTSEVLGVELQHGNLGETAGPSERPTWVCLFPIFAVLGSAVVSILLTSPLCAELLQPRAGCAQFCIWDPYRGCEDVTLYSQVYKHSSFRVTLESPGLQGAFDSPFLLPGCPVSLLAGP